MYLQLWHCKTWISVLYPKAYAFFFFLMQHFALSTGSLCQKYWGEDPQNLVKEV